MKRELIRNFCIIAHIDHGKSTLADRILQFTGAVSEREFRELLLDDMDLERERGITIKASAVRINYRAKDGQRYILNLIDTPGHVDFSYEVSKALAACEGALLLVDAAQGVEAQTVSCLNLAQEHHLIIIPVINKIDLPQADVETTRHQLQEILKLDSNEAILASAKEGRGTEEILERIVKDIPPPAGNDEKPLQALIFDSKYDSFRGVFVYVRMVNGTIRRGMKIRLMGKGGDYEVEEVGGFRPASQPEDMLSAGEVGYLVANIKDARDVAAGDTVTTLKDGASAPLPGYREVRPLVYSGIYPINNKDFTSLRDALDKLRLTDASFIYSPENSPTLGMGFRCGFLGLLHMEIIEERLTREYDLDLIATTPSVAYRITGKNGKAIEVDNPAKMPLPAQIERMEEPILRAFMIVPADTVGEVMKLSQVRRGQYHSRKYLDEKRMMLIYDLPLVEVLVDFYDKLKSITRGYGSFDYEFKGYQSTSLVKLDILVNGEVCDSFSRIVNRETAPAKARILVEVLKENIPRQLYEVVIQARLGAQIVARERVRPLGKNVTSKCYGGDITRKRKLWEKQKRGKKRMKQFGKAQIPREAFFAALKV